MYDFTCQLCGQPSVGKTPVWCQACADFVAAGDAKVEVVEVAEQIAQGYREK